MSFNGLTLHHCHWQSFCVAARIRLFAWRSPRMSLQSFLVSIIPKQKWLAKMFILVPEAIGSLPVICAAARFSYAYEIYYVPNSSRSQSNVVQAFVTNSSR
jgi:hypothetical protein